ncbi:MAG: thioredoxin family protein [Candidatus Helarchaeota archaeon]
MSEKNDIKLKIEIYTSPTCPYCPAALRMLQKAASIYEDAIKVTKIDVTTPSGQELADFYNIQATPTIIMNGVVKFRGPPPNESRLFKEIELYISEKVKAKAAKKRRAQRREIDMMYG